MPSLLEEYRRRIRLIDNVKYHDANARLSSLLQWFEEQSEIAFIIQELKKTINAENLIKSTNINIPPITSTIEELAAVGIWLMEKCKEGLDIVDISREHGIRPSANTRNLQEHVDETIERYIEPTLNYIEEKLEDQTEEENLLQDNFYQLTPPLEITESLERFFKNHPNYDKTAFLIMQFGETIIHEQIVKIIKETLKKYGIEVLRADDKQYHDDLFPNVLTYLYGCSFGIAVFERLENEVFNPNVSLEVGYMTALKKSVCLLKDKTLTTLHTDLVGKLYKTFDPQNSAETIPPELEKWVRDKDIITL